jgi:cytochrome oxidase assembly protein ShyY1
MIETWQPVSFAVTLSAESKFIRKRPLDGRNGLWLVNYAIHDSGFRVPVLLGWLPASAGANVELEIPNLPQQKFQAIGIVRDFEALEEAVDLPKNQILTLNPTEISSDVPYFVQLTSPNMLLTPEFRSVPVPNISQGPHFFYAIQWLVFGVIALIGTTILTRQELNVKP